MITETKEVKSKSVVVGTASFEKFDSVAEAVDAKGEATVLDLINTQNKTNALNAIRASVTGKPSKKALMKKALSTITPAEFAEVAGDEAALENLINKKVQELESAEPVAEVVQVDEEE